MRRGEPVVAALLLTMLYLGSVVRAQDGPNLMVTPNGKTVDLREAKHHVLVRLHKRHPSLRSAIEGEYARRCDPAALGEAEKSAGMAQQSALDRQLESRPPADEVGGPYAAAGDALGSAISLGLSETKRARQVLYCTTAERLGAEAEAEFLKRVDALTFYGMSQERAERAAANDDIYEAELARLQREADRP